MDNEQKPLESQEELNAEKEIAVEVSEETLREKLAEQLGLDPDEQSDILDRAVKLKQEDNKRLSKAIEQKRKYREQLSTTKKTETTSQTSSKETPDFKTLVSQEVTERLEQRDLESLDLPDELAQEVKRISKMNGVSIREAARDPYFQYKKQEYEKAERIKNATPSRTNGSKFVADPSKPLNVSDYDLSTQEGREAWKKVKEARRKAQS